jgi:hypothetical protein
MTIYIFGFPQSMSSDRTCTNLTRFPVTNFPPTGRLEFSEDEDSKGVSQRNHSQCPNLRVFATDSSDA